MIANLDLNCLFFVLIALLLSISKPKSLKILHKQTIQITSAQHNFDDIFQFSPKSKEIDRKWVQSLLLVDTCSVLLIKTRNFGFQMPKTLFKSNLRPYRASHFDRSSDNKLRFFRAFSGIFNLLKSWLTYVKTETERLLRSSVEKVSGEFGIFCRNWIGRLTE